MSERLTLREWRKREGLLDADAYLEALTEYTHDSICPVLCTECDPVEPDGTCEHGHPSVLIAAGLI